MEGERRYENERLMAVMTELNPGVRFVVAEGCSSAMPRSSVKIIEPVLERMRGAIDSGEARTGSNF